MLEYIRVQTRSHLDAMQVAERNLSEEKADHARAQRLMTEHAWQATHWRKKCGEARAARVEACEEAT